MAALLYHAHYHVSTTDVECQWSAPHVKGGNGVVKLKDIYPAKQSYKAGQRKATDAEIAEFRKQLGSTNIVGFSWLLRPEATREASMLIPDIEEILHSPQYISAEDKDDFVIKTSKITKEIISQIVNLTKGQHVNENWHIARKHRLTASRFGMVLSAIKRNKFPPSLFKSLAEGYNLDRVAAVQWGKEHEKTALQAFREAVVAEVEPTGFWLDRSGFLGASPDGLVGSDAVVEIKCPYKYRDALSFKELDKKYFCWYEGEDLIINQEHNYYHQVQGQLYLSGRNVCHFVVWTLKNTLIFQIEKDMEWGKIWKL